MLPLIRLPRLLQYIGDYDYFDCITPHPDSPKYMDNGYYNNNNNIKFVVIYLQIPCINHLTMLYLL